MWFTSIFIVPQVMPGEIPASAGQRAMLQFMSVHVMQSHARVPHAAFTQSNNALVAFDDVDRFHFAASEKSANDAAEPQACDEHSTTSSLNETQMLPKLRFEIVHHDFAMFLIESRERPTKEPGVRTGCDKLAEPLEREISSIFRILL